VLADHASFGELRISREEWNWVEDLIQEVKREVQQEIKRATFARNLFQWDLAARQFHKIEQRRLLSQKPTDVDLQCHAVCLHALLAIGHALVLGSRLFHSEELDELGVKREEIEAYVAELEQSLGEWHHGFSKAEINQAREKLFGAKA